MKSNKITFATLLLIFIFGIFSSHQKIHLEKFKVKHQLKTQNQDLLCGQADLDENLIMTCPQPTQVFQTVNFASFGNPSGKCDNLVKGSCNAAESVNVVSKLCIGKNQCHIDVSQAAFKENCKAQNINDKQQQLYVLMTCTPGQVPPPPAQVQAVVPPPVVQKLTRFVRVQRGTQGKDCLQIAQLMVFNDKGVNVALRKRAYASSQWDGCNPATAVDGTASIRNHPQAFHIGGHECNSPNAYWEVDLGDNFVVKKITYYNRQDCCRERSRGLNIILYDKDKKVLDSKFLKGGDSESLDF